MKTANFLFKISVIVPLFLAVFTGSFTQAIYAQDIPSSNSQSSVEPQTRPKPVENTANYVCKGILSTQHGTITQDTTVASCKEDTEQGFGFLVRRIVDIFSIVVGAVSVIMIIIGGFKYIVSGGNSNGVQSAKNTILYAVVGLVIVLFAQILVRFVLVNVTQAVK